MRLCEVCGAEERANSLLISRGAIEVCPECHACERRYNEETGFMIERRNGYWITITNTFRRNVTDGASSPSTQRSAT